MMDCNKESERGRDRECVREKEFEIVTVSSGHTQKEIYRYLRPHRELS